MLTQPPCASSILALATTVHLGLVALRNHRRPTSGPVSSLAIVSLLFSATPWVFPSVPGLVLGFALHLAWFVICELLVGGPALARMPARPSAVIQPAVSSRASAPIEARPPATAPAARGFFQVPVLAALDETADIKTIRLGRPDDFAFEPGQFVTVRVKVAGQDHVRCYSISSAPEVGGYFEVTVRRQGLVSSALHASARPGAMLSIRRPNGRFVYPSGDDRPIVLLAGGVGVTPLMSMLRHAVSAEPTRPVTLFYSAHTADEFAFRDELATIVRRHPQARVVLAATRDPAPPSHVHPGRIDETLLRAFVPYVADALSFICGPRPMIDGMNALLARMGTSPGNVRHEVFEAAVAASAVAPRTTAPGGHQMRCARSDRTVTIQPGETLLEAAERDGVDVPSLCRAGVCGTCRTQVTEGDVVCASTTLDDRDRAEGFVLACVATARSSCTVNL